MSILWAPWRMSYIRSHSQQPIVGCIFCDKPAGAHDRDELILLRGQYNYLMMNLYPYNNGHLLVAPFAHRSSVEDLPVETLTEMMVMTNQGLAALRQALKPHGFNLGVNLGAVAGAGVAEHVHMHIVPRWGADTNYMTVTGRTRVIPEALETTYERLLAVLDPMAPPDPRR